MKYASVASLLGSFGSPFLLSFRRPRLPVILRHQKQWLIILSAAIMFAKRK